MATFYKIKDESGKSYIGISDSDDIRNLKKSLSEAGWFVVKIYPVKESRYTLFRKKVGLDSLVMFTHQLGSLVEAGVPFLRTLDILWRQTDEPMLQIVISQMKESLGKGSSLSEALSKFPDVFPPVYCALLRVAETGGELVVTLKKIREYLEYQRVFISRIKRATIYPLIVIGFAVLVVILMLVWVIPTFQAVLTQLKVELPFFTQMVLAISSVLRSVGFWIGIILLILLMFIFHKRFFAIPAVRYKIDSLKLRLPVFGSIIYTAIIARFVRSLSLLLGTGVPIARSLDVLRPVIINKKMIRVIDSLQKNIAEGSSISNSLAKARIFPMLLIQMVAVGEESGTLPEMLEKVSVHFEEVLDYRINKFLTAIEPLLIILVGGVVVFILLSVYLPIFKVWQGLAR